MKKILLLFLISISAIAQTKYTSLNDACVKNTSGGFTNHQNQYWWLTFTVGNAVYLNNSAVSNLKVPRGFYYNPSTNQSFSTNSRGRITAIQNCGSIVTAPLPPTPSATSGTVGVVFSGTATEAGTIEIFDQSNNQMVASVQTTNTSPFAWSYTPSILGTFRATLGVSGKPVSALSTAWSITSGGGGGGNPNLAFEQNTLQRLIDAETELANNVLNLGVFPSSAPATSNYYLRLLNASSMEYLNAKGSAIVGRGLATGLGNNTMYTAAEVPAEHRSIWKIYPDWAAPRNETQIYNDARTEFNTTRLTQVKERFGNAVAWKYTMIDNETADWTVLSKNRAFIRGWHDEAKVHYPNHVYVHYGNPFTVDYPSIQNGGVLFPKIHLPNYNNFKTLNGLIEPSYASTNNILYGAIINYLRSPLPMTTSFYKKNNSGQYILDGEGHRQYVDYPFSETYRGINHTWTERRPNDPPDAISGHTYKQQTHEVHLAVTGLYIAYAQAVTALQALSNDAGLGNDISNVHAVSPYQTCSVLRLDCEANTWQNTYRPLDKYSTKMLYYISSYLTKNVWWYANLTNTCGLYDCAGCGNPAAFCSMYQAVSEGQPANVNLETSSVFDGPKNVHNGVIHQNYAMSYESQMLNRDYGLMTKTDKILAFTDILQIHDRRELIGVGVLKNNVASIALMYPYQDTGESTTVTIGNTRNSQTYTVTLTSREPKRITCVFSGLSNLQTNEVWIQYTTARGNAGQTIKVSGNLTQHDI